MKTSEYSRIKLSNIPQEFIDEYDLTAHNFDGWVYLDILRGCYRLPQAGKLANDIIRIRLNKYGYYEFSTTPGL